MTSVCVPTSVLYRLKKNNSLDELKLTWKTNLYRNCAHIVISDTIYVLPLAISESRGMVRYDEGELNNCKFPGGAIFPLNQVQPVV
jgi:hypothetical protein